jgi:hypothetical protein
MLADRGRLLTVPSILFGILALSNFMKFLPLTDDTGFVLFGQRLAGAANVVAGLIAGTVLFVYAAGIWRLRRWALPLGWFYAAYVVANIVLYRLRHPMPSGTGGPIFEVAYAVIAIGVSTGTALLLMRRRSGLA